MLAGVIFLYVCKMRRGSMCSEITCVCFCERVHACVCVCLPVCDFCYDVTPVQLISDK